MTLKLEANNGDVPIASIRFTNPAEGTMDNSLRNNKLLKVLAVSLELFHDRGIRYTTAPIHTKSHWYFPNIEEALCDIADCQGTQVPQLQFITDSATDFDWFSVHVRRSLILPRVLSIVVGFRGDSAASAVPGTSFSALQTVLKKYEAWVGQPALRPHRVFQSLSCRDEDALYAAWDQIAEGDRELAVKDYLGMRSMDMYLDDRALAHFQV